MKLSDLRELPLAPTAVAEGTWDRARQRRRRTAVTASAAAVAVTVASAIAIGTLGGGTSPQPAPTPPAPSPTPEPAPTPTPGPTIVTDLPDYAAMAATVPVLDPTRVSNLSEDPMAHAVLAVIPSSAGRDWTVIDVLGDDGRWRLVDVPDLELPHDRGGNHGYALNPTSLSPDRTRLAIPQPDEVVVVDLTTGTSQRREVGGANESVVWQDETRLLVNADGRATAKVLDVTTGAVAGSSFTANTGFAPDGSWVTWGREGTLISSDGTKVQAEMANGGGLLLTSPLVDDELAVGLGGHDLVEPAMTYVDMAGVGVVDRRTGKLRGFLYTEGPDAGLVVAYLLGLDGDAVTVAVGVEPDQSEMLVLRWRWSTGEVEPLAVVRAGVLSGTME